MPSPAADLLDARLDITTLPVIIACDEERGEERNTNGGRREEKKKWFGDERVRSKTRPEPLLNEWTLNPTPSFERARDL